MDRLWTLRRVNGAGAVAGLAAFLLWPFVGLYGLVMLSLFTLVAAVAVLCGFALLFITLRDMATRPRRGSRIRPMRGFDAALATLLLVFGWFELHDALGLFPI